MERIQKILARLGLGSRRQIEQWIVEGKILVNGRLAQLGEKISGKENIVVNGKRAQFSNAVIEPQVLIYHKPVGEICTRKDTEGRLTVFAKLPKIKAGKWINIGRLDLNTSGLLLFANDGDLAHRLTHPKTQIEREYAVRIFGQVEEKILERLTQGVALEDGQARFADIIDAGGQGANHWYHVIVTEGRNRLVRRLWESQGVAVSRLIRVRFGPIILPRSLPRGQYTFLKGKALQQILNLVA